MPPPPLILRRLVGKTRFIPRFFCRNIIAGGHNGNKYDSNIISGGDNGADSGAEFGDKIMITGGDSSSESNIITGGDTFAECQVAGESHEVCQSDVHLVDSSCRLKEIKELNSMPLALRARPLVDTKGPEVLKNIKIDAQRLKELNSLQSKKEIFEREIKLYLLSRCLLCDKKMGDRYIKTMHYMVEQATKKFPDYVTCLGLMNLLVTRSRRQWQPILKSIFNNRIIVIVDWENLYESVEAVFYDHGLVLPPQTGKKHERDVFKAETDACFDYRSGGKGVVASLLWKNSQIIDCEIVKNLKLNSSEHGESIGLLRVLTKGRIHGIKKLDVVTDNEENLSIMVGRRDVCKSSHPETLMAALEKAKEYDLCRFRLESREVLSHVDEIAKKGLSGTVDSLRLANILSKHSSLFLGLPVIRIKQNKRRETQRLGNWNVDGKMMKYDTRRYYLDVDEDIQRIEAVNGLLFAVNPDHIIILCTPESSSELSLKFSSSVNMMTDRCDTPCIASDSVLFLNDTMIPRLFHQKTLVIHYDNKEKSIQYTNAEDQQFVMEIIIVTNAERRSIGDCIPKIDPLVSGYFMGGGKGGGYSQSSSNFGKGGGGSRPSSSN